MVANRDVLDQLVVELLERETLLKDDIAKLFTKLKRVKPRPAWTGSADRIPSNQPPVALSPAKSQVVEEVSKAPVKRARKKAAPKSE